MGDSANLPQTLFGLGTGAVTHVTSANISGTGDVYCDTFSVTGVGTVLTMWNNKIVARRKITIGVGSSISGDGAPGSGVGPGSGGVSNPIGILSTLGSGNSGGDGANGANNGSDSSAFSSDVRGVGGVGGVGGDSSVHSGGNGAPLSNSSILSNQDRDFFSIVRGWALTQGNIYYFGGGTGGGGGAADGATGGGGGGAGGNVVYLCAPIIEIAGGVHSNGGAGADGVGSSVGGGGGGGGGLIILVYNELILTGALAVSGGAGGNGIGGTNGANGTDGHIYHINGLSTQLGPVT